MAHTFIIHRNDVSANKVLRSEKKRGCISVSHWCRYHHVCSFACAVNTDHGGCVKLTLFAKTVKYAPEASTHWFILALLKMNELGRYPFGSHIFMRNFPTGKYWLATRRVLPEAAILLCIHIRNNGATIAANKYEKFSTNLSSVPKH